MKAMQKSNYPMTYRRACCVLGNGDIGRGKRLVFGMAECLEVLPKQKQAGQLSRDRIYLAAPYTSPDPEIQQKRFELATLAAGKLIRQGHVVFSPISMGHPISTMCASIPADFKYWEKSCLSYLNAWATKLVVLMLDGWRESRGVTAEIAFAVKKGLPVEFLDQEWLD